MIQGWLSPNEGKLLAYFAKRTNGPIIEIGSFQGKSTIFMARVTKNPIYAIDPHYLHSYRKFSQNTKKYKNITPVKKTSAAANKDWKLPIALLHIDGAHGYKFAKEDLRLWLPHLKDNGVIVCHDAFAPYPEVFRAVREGIFQKGNWKYLGALDSQIFAVKGKPENLWQKLNIARQKFFLTLASNVWHDKKLPENLRFFIVNRLLKIFFLNKFMVKAIFDNTLINR